jgi:hypothetical protein
MTILVGRQAERENERPGVLTAVMALNRMAKGAVNIVAAAMGIAMVATGVVVTAMVVTGVMGTATVAKEVATIVGVSDGTEALIDMASVTGTGIVGVTATLAVEETGTGGVQAVVAMMTARCVPKFTERCLLHQMFLTWHETRMFPPARAYWSCGSAFTVMIYVNAIKVIFFDCVR